MPAIGATANGEARSTEPILIGSCYPTAKLLHGAGYSLLALLFYRALRGEGFTIATTVLVAVLLTSLYGASDEWHQKFTPLRSSDVQDWLADTTGGLLGAAAFAGAAWLKAAASEALGPQRS